MKTNFEETPIEKAVKVKFYGVSNEDLVRRANNAPDFGWDDEGCEISRRRRKGVLNCQMQGNTIVIIEP